MARFLVLKFCGFSLSKKAIFGAFCEVHMAINCLYKHRLRHPLWENCEVLFAVVFAFRNVYLVAKQSRGVKLSNISHDVPASHDLSECSLVFSLLCKSSMPSSYELYFCAVWLSRQQCMI